MITLRSEWRNVKVNARFERLVVLGQQFRIHTPPTPGNRKVRRAWSCVVECDCGNVKIVLVGDLPRGFQLSCGCHRQEVGVANGKAKRRHGESGTPLHNLWHLIKLRCTDPNQDSYPDYGGRGISVFAVWSEKYESFRDYALAHGYQPGLQIDRYPNVDGNYEPGNIRFVTCKENNRNRRNTKFLTAFGETKSLAEWTDDDRCRVSLRRLWSRLTGGKNKTKWNPESAISTPPIMDRRDRRSIPASLVGTGCDIKTIYEARKLTHGS